MALDKIFKERRYFIPILSGLFLLQVTAWWNLKDIKPELGILPEVPGIYERKFLALGDDQLLYRIFGYQIQIAGDSFGRATPLKNYDYKKLAEWFKIFDALDWQSNYVPSMAAYYYSDTQNKPDTRYIIDYLMENAAKNPGDKWWWMVQAMLIAKYKLNDNNLALDIANKIAAIKGDLPLWARQMPAFLYADLGEKEQALVIIKDILKNYKNLPKEELNFMYYFVKDRLKMVLPEEMKQLEEK